jgi:hypothetical protein
MSPGGSIDEVSGSIEQFNSSYGGTRHGYKFITKFKTAEVQSLF